MILARGLGTRMQKKVAGVTLNGPTAKLADQGAKGLIPIGRPFLDHSLQAMLEAGVRDFCLVVPPGASAIRSYYEAVAGRLDEASICFAEQAEPLGTANAVAAGSDWAGDRPFMLFNSDNFYTASTIVALASAPAPATVAFEREAMIAKSNIPPDRIARFAALEIDQDDCLVRIVEKPENPDDYLRDGKLYVSMNSFLFTPQIFAACAAIDAHPQRGEYEITTAVQHTIDRMNLRYHAIKCDEGVLDLTGRKDIESVRKMLAGHEIRFWAPQQLEP